MRDALRDWVVGQLARKSVAKHHKLPGASITHYITDDGQHRFKVHVDGHEYTLNISGSVMYNNYVVAGEAVTMMLVSAVRMVLTTALEEHKEEIENFEKTLEHLK